MLFNNVWGTVSQVMVNSKNEITIKMSKIKKLVEIKDKY